MSGARADRRELLRLLKAIAPGDVVTVTRIDRLACSTFDLFAFFKQIVDAGEQFRSLAEPWADTATSTGRLMISELGGLADVERDLIRNRTAEPRSRAKTRGQHIGRLPKLTPQQATEARRRRAEGATLKELAKSYNVGLATGDYFATYRMSESGKRIADSPGQLCVRCSKSLVEGAEFCAFCGLRAVPSETKLAINTYIEASIKSELAERIKDEKSLVRDTADKIEEIIKRRFAIYMAISGLIVGILAFFGVKNVQVAIEPLITTLEQKTKDIQVKIDQTADQAAVVKENLDRLAQDTDAQTARISRKSGEIDQKFSSLDVTISETKIKLDQRLKALDTKVEDISTKLMRYS